MDRCIDGWVGVRTYVPDAVGEVEPSKIVGSESRLVLWDMPFWGHTPVSSPPPPGPNKKFLRERYYSVEAGAGATPQRR